MSARHSPLSDRELVLAAQAGDGSAVAELYTRFWRAARASAYGVLGEYASAEDAAAEAFRLALPTLSRLRDPDRFAPWLRRIVKRVAMRQARQTARATEPSEAAVHPDVPDPNESLERRELAVLVCQAVERLPPAEREAIVLHYFEGYACEDAARFVDIPVGSFRRRLHDGRVRLRACLTALLASPSAEDPQLTQLHARVQALLSSDASPGELYDVMRRLLVRRPVPYQVVATLVRGLATRASKTDFAAGARRLMTRPDGPLFNDSGPVGEAARALRAALRDFQDWTLDSDTVFQAFPSFIRRYQDGETMSDPALLPPGLAAGEPGRHVRSTRGLLFSAEEGTVMDLGELLLRSGSLAAFKQSMRHMWISDVLDVYWIDTRPIGLAEVESWLTALASQVASAAEGGCSVQVGVRYRTALRFAFSGDPRPAAIGGVLAAWPGAPEGITAVHVRLYLEPWAQVQSGHPVEAQSIRRNSLMESP
ncbi:MAG TPA: sigma-70 family RNA polymerase sigma factor [Gemmatimonadales bacterium]|nr:sigma-70 family RNA polymerase sigma factor [Gemmatimonadales bacterium]